MGQQVAAPQEENFAQHVGNQAAAQGWEGQRSHERRSARGRGVAIKKKNEGSHVESGHALFLEDGEDGGKHPTVKEEKKDEEKEGVERENQMGGTRFPASCTAAYLTCT